MKVLFICKHNRFRSKVAEAFFNFYSKKEKLKHKAISRGIVKDIDVAISVVEVMGEKGIQIRNLKSRKISKKDIEQADIIVIVADNVHIEEENDNKLKKKILRWEISDIDQADFDGIGKRVELIEKKVRELIRKLKS